MFYLSIRCAKVIKILQYTISTPQIHQLILYHQIQPSNKQIITHSKWLSTTNTTYILLRSMQFRALSTAFCSFCSSNL